MIAIFDNRGKAQAYSALIHTWLKKNRPGYKADKWSDIDERRSDSGEYYVKVPPDYEALNKGIAKVEERLTISKDAINQLDKLPDNWKNKK